VGNATVHPWPPVASRGAARYQALLRPAHPSSGASSSAEHKRLLERVYLAVRTSEASLGPATSYNYSLLIPTAGGAKIECDTAFGCLYGLETLAQALFHGGGCIESGVRVTDAPAYEWRGLMLDVSSRFAPVASVLRQIDAMAAAKMSVLHLHLSEGAYRLPSAAMPQLNSGVRHWSKADVANIVQYAHDRGVRCVPEIDVPGHAMGFAPGRNATADGPGLRFCNESAPHLVIPDTPIKRDPL
jgi:hypothetical protein